MNNFGFRHLFLKMLVPSFFIFLNCPIQANAAPLEVSAGADFSVSEYSSFSLQGSVAAEAGTPPYTHEWLVLGDTCLAYKAIRDRNGYVACTAMRSALVGNGVNLDTLTPTFTAADLTSGVTSLPMVFRLTTTDADGNQTYDDVQVTFGLDTTAPTVSLSYEPSLSDVGSFNVSLVFSEIVVDFTEDDVTVENGTKGTFAGSGKSYSLVVTPVSALTG